MNSMKQIEPPDSHYLSAAMGWLGLGDWREAEAELNRIAPALQSHLWVLETRFEVCAKAGGKWDKAAEIARALVMALPKEAQFWIWHAYSTRRRKGGGVPQAREILRKAHQLIPDEPLISYNLGCYECQLGHLQEAWTWLESAFALGDAKKFRSMALEDLDLQALWPKLKEL
jgi:tetratricopeptide (TPR) repeat protein